MFDRLLFLIGHLHSEEDNLGQFVYSLNKTTNMEF